MNGSGSFGRGEDGTLMLSSQRLKKRHPLKKKPGRAPGQSVAEHRAQLLEDLVLFPFIVAALLVALAVIEWFRHLKPTAPQPWLYTGVAVVALVFAAVRVIRAIPKSRALKLAEEGERSVAEGLETLSAKGYEIFHDVLADGFNIDHVLIGPAGVFTVETKTWSKPKGGNAVVTLDGESIRVAGWEPDRNPIAQARGQAAWLGEVLRQRAERNVRVRSAVVFPGWWVEESTNPSPAVWVLNPDRLPAWLEREPAVLSAEERHLFASHLRRTIER